MRGVIVAAEMWSSTTRKYASNRGDEGRQDGYAVGGGGVKEPLLAARSIEIPRQEEWPGEKHKGVEFIWEAESASTSVEVNARSQHKVE
jgi:hypothetical protein